MSKTLYLLGILPLLTIFLIFNNNVAVYGLDISNNASAINAGNGQDRSEKEIKNEKIVREFYNNVFTAKNASAAVNYLEEDYIQHNPTVPTGRAAFINAFTQIFEQNGFSLQIQRTYADGDYVIVHSFSPMGDTDSAVIDIYRINDNGKIAEHWDVIQQIPSSTANNNTMFYLN
jgi:predicted SnoaL-like aldol condensation-catalyzing enzyme